MAGGGADAQKVCLCGPADRWNKDIVNNYNKRWPLLGVARKTYTSKDQGVLTPHSDCIATEYAGYRPERQCLRYFTEIYTNAKWVLGESALLLHDWGRRTSNAFRNITADKPTAAKPIRPATESQCTSLHLFNYIHNRFSILYIHITLKPQYSATVCSPQNVAAYRPLRQIEIRNDIGFLFTDIHVR